MKKNEQVRIYAITVSIIAAILLLLVIFLSVRLRVEKAQLMQAESARIIEESTPAAGIETEPETETAAEAEDQDTEIVQRDNRIEEQTDNSVYNVGGIVGWESGNNDSLNVINAWKNMLSQLDIDADIAFIGDSITHRVDLRPYFPEHKVVNLGCGGDTIRGVYNRTDMLSYVKAEKIVVMCGVNVLRADTVDFCRTEYAGLLNAVAEHSPDSEVYVCSILPMSREWQDAYCPYQVTENFNEIIKELAAARGMTYVDLYPLFVTDENVIDPEYTVDGIHLSAKGYDLWISALYPYLSYGEQTDQEAEN